MADRQKLLADLSQKAKQLRRDVIVSIGVGVAGHIGGSFSTWASCSTPPWPRAATSPWRI